MTARSRTSLSLDTRVLGSLLGHNCRRAHLAVLEHVVPKVSSYGLSAPSFAVLSLVQHNPGLSSGQICRALRIRTSNIVAVIAGLKSQDLIEQRPHPTDKRMLGIHLTASGRRLTTRAYRDIVQAERSATAMLTDAEREQLIVLLRRIHSSGADRPGSRSEQE